MDHIFFVSQWTHFRRKGWQDPNIEHDRTRQGKDITITSQQHRIPLFINKSTHQTCGMRRTTTTSSPRRLLQVKHSLGRNCVCRERERDRTIPLYPPQTLRHEVLTELNSGALLATSWQKCADTSRLLPSCECHNTEIHCRLNTGSFHNTLDHPLARNINEKTRNKRCHHMITWGSTRHRRFGKLAQWPTSASFQTG